MVKKLNIFYLYLVGDIALILLSLYLGGLWLLNTQVAFIASMLIVFASYLGYERFVKRQVSHEVIEDEEESQEDEDEDAKEEKFFEKSKRVVGGFKGAFSPYRLFAYLFLILGFFYLNRHGLFSPFAFLAGLGVVPLVTLISAFFVK